MVVLDGEFVIPEAVVAPDLLVVDVVALVVAAARVLVVVAVRVVVVVGLVVEVAVVARVAAVKAAARIVIVAGLVVVVGGRIVAVRVVVVGLVVARAVVECVVVVAGSVEGAAGSMLDCRADSREINSGSAIDSMAAVSFVVTVVGMSSLCLFEPTNAPTMPAIIKIAQNQNCQRLNTGLAVAVVGSGLGAVSPSFSFPAFSLKTSKKMSATKPADRSPTTILTDKGVKWKSHCTIVRPIAPKIEKMQTETTLLLLFMIRLHS